MLYRDVVPRGDRDMSSSFATLEMVSLALTIYEVVKIARVVLLSCFNNKHQFTKREVDRYIDSIIFFGGQI